MIRPTLAHESALWQRGASRLVGVDEVGVGPLCGAVVAAAVVLPPDVEPAGLAGVRDSKTIHAPRVRERLADRVQHVAERVGIGAASPREVDRLNVRGATALAMRRALARIGAYDHAFIDGTPQRSLRDERHTFVVRGDAECLSIACASLVAKVTRDRLMRLLGARYPAYGWEHNAGYATTDHLAALREHGPTPHHRQRYRPVAQAELFPFEPTPPGALDEPITDSA